MTNEELIKLVSAITSKIGNMLYFFGYDENGEVEDVVEFKIAKFVLENGLGYVRGVFLEDGELNEIYVSLCQLGSLLFCTREEAEEARERAIARRKSND